MFSRVIILFDNIPPIAPLFFFWTANGLITFAKILLGSSFLPSVIGV